MAYDEHVIPYVRSVVINGQVFSFDYYGLDNLPDLTKDSRPLLNSSHFIASDAVARALQDFVPKEDGKSLSTNDFTNEDKELLGCISSLQERITRLENFVSSLVNNLSSLSLDNGVIVSLVGASVDNNDVISFSAGMPSGGIDSNEILVFDNSAASVTL